MHAGSGALRHAGLPRYRPDRRGAGHHRRKHGWSAPPAGHRSLRGRPGQHPEDLARLDGQRGQIGGSGTRLFQRLTRLACGRYFRGQGRPEGLPDGHGAGTLRAIHSGAGSPDRVVQHLLGIRGSARGGEETSRYAVRRAQRRSHAARDKPRCRPGGTGSLDQAEHLEGVSAGLATAVRTQGAGHREHG